MTRNAFTLIELLVVLVVISLLAIVLSPWISGAMTMARQAQCASNLHQISGTFATPSGTPESWQWPANRVNEPGIYLCPEVDDEGMGDITEYEIWLIDEGIYITFADTSSMDGLCKVIDKGDYMEYWFDDGWIRDLDDFLFHVTKSDPRRATYRPDLSGRGIGRKVSLCHLRKPVPGWEDLKNNAAHDYFTLPAKGLTHFGINAALGEMVSVDNVVLLDYVRVRANLGEDMSQSLDESARHGGRINVLWGDMSVRSESPTALDPMIAPEIWRP
jgi:prepilin-type N-terminal cleavage/methylation domain-containing protein/prepilin-type processing-associated H-X9-DG protein